MLTFETERLWMRLLQPEDQTLYCACYTDQKLMQLIGAPLDQEAALRSFAAALKMNAALPVRRRDWVMLEKKSGACIGLLSLVGDKTNPEPINGDLGAIIINEFQNRGYSLEGTGALVDIAFGISHFEKLHTRHRSENAAVGRVMSKLQFSYTIEQIDGIENWHWSLHRNQWQMFPMGQYLKRPNADEFKSPNAKV
jgi:RimJ/RimL family protein N-acetyltransferase